MPHLKTSSSIISGPACIFPFFNPKNLQAPLQCTNNSEEYYHIVWKNVLKGLSKIDLSAIHKKHAFKFVPSPRYSGCA